LHLRALRRCTWCEDDARRGSGGAAVPPRLPPPVTRWRPLRIGC